MAGAAHGRTTPRARSGLTFLPVARRAVIYSESSITWCRRSRSIGLPRRRCRRRAACVRVVGVVGRPVVVTRRGWYFRETPHADSVLDAPHRSVAEFRIDAPGVGGPEAPGPPRLRAAGQGRRRSAAARAHARLPEHHLRAHRAQDPMALVARVGARG